MSSRASVARRGACSSSCSAAKAVSENSTATLDTSSTGALELEAAQNHVAIPYTAITSYEYRDENRFRLGVLPAIAVGIVKARARRHLITVARKDEAGIAQTFAFGTTKDRARGLIKVLDVRSPQASPTGLPWRKSH